MPLIYHSTFIVPQDTVKSQAFSTICGGWFAECRSVALYVVVNIFLFFLKIMLDIYFVGDILRVTLNIVEGSNMADYHYDNIDKRIEQAFRLAAYRLRVRGEWQVAYVILNALRRMAGRA